MSISSKQIGWSNEANLLHNILKQVERLTQVIGSSGGGGSTTLAGLTDVSIVAPIPGNVLTWDGSKWVNAPPSGGVAYSTVGRIPFMNPAGNGFVYDAYVYFDVANHVTNFSDGLVVNGSFGGNGYSAFFGEGHTINASASGGGVVTDSFAAGYLHTIGNGVDYFSGATSFTIGFGNQNYATLGFVGGGQARLLHSGEGSGGLHTTGGFVYGISVSGPEPVTARASAVNISQNTPSQTVGHGAYGPLSVILGGSDHNIPIDSPRSVVLGGSLIKARAAAPDQVYVPNLNIATIPLNDNALVQVLVRDSVTGQIKYRTSSTIAAAAGVTGNVQFNSAGALAGSNNLFWDNVNGNLGIGTATPRYTEHIKFGTKSNIVFGNGSGGLTANDLYVIHSIDETIKTYVVDAQEFAVGGLNFAFAISPASNVGIGTATPSQYQHGGTNKLLEIQNANTTANAQAHVFLTSGFSGTGASSLGAINWILPAITPTQKFAGFVNVSTDASHTLANPATNMFFSLRDGTTGNIADRMVIKYNGFVGIGTTTPLAKFHVAGAAMFSGADGQYGNGVIIGASPGAFPAPGTFGNAALTIYQPGDRYGLLIGLAPTGGGSYIQAQRVADSAAVFNLYLNPNGGAVILPALAAADVGVLTVTADGTIARSASFTLDVSNNLVAADGRNLFTGLVNGTRIGGSGLQKLGFWGATPIVQPTTAIASTPMVNVGGGVVNANDTFAGYTIGKVVTALRNAGILA